MAMLERRGIVRKTDDDDEQVEAEAAADRPRPDTDIRSILGQQADDGPKITPAPRQPVPGMVNPIMPGSQPQPVQSTPPQPVKPAEPDSPQLAKPSEPEQTPPVKPQEPERPQPVKPPEPERPSSVRPPEPELSQPVKPPEPARPEPAKPQEAAPPFGRFGATGSTPAPTAPAPLTSAARPATPAAPFDPIAALGSIESIVSEKPPEAPSDNYTDRYLEVDELYEALAIKSKRTDSIYLVEEYLKTLPDSLPDESRREIVTKIVAASGFDFDRLMGDGVLRVRMLKEYAEKFAQYTEDYVNDRNSELDALEQQIMRVRTLIEGRRELHKRQFFTIEAEAQRLKEILTFISG